MYIFLYLLSVESSEKKHINYMAMLSSSAYEQITKIDPEIKAELAYLIEKLLESYNILDSKFPNAATEYLRDILRVIIEHNLPLLILDSLYSLEVSEVLKKNLMGPINDTNLPISQRVGD